ncbi:MAG: hypothetical protein AABP62_31590 [Planctomycetota bacterium]
MATNLECVISEIDGKFYWASRENVLMRRVESGAFITYVAANAAGYVRTYLFTAVDLGQE